MAEPRRIPIDELSAGDIVYELPDLGVSAIKKKEVWSTKHVVLVFQERLFLCEVEVNRVEALGSNFVAPVATSIEADKELFHSQQEADLAASAGDVEYYEKGMLVARQNQRIIEERSDNGKGDKAEDGQEEGEKEENSQEG